MDWKKEVKSWVAILAVFAFLYFTGLIPVIQGALQSVSPDEIRATFLFAIARDIAAGAPRPVLQE